MITVCPDRRRQKGFSIAEVLATIVLLGFALAPALFALQGAMHAAEIDTGATPAGYQLLEMMESTVARPFDGLLAAAGDSATPSIYSDPPGTTNRRLVYISAYDLDDADSDNNPFTGTDAGILWIRVQLEGTTHYLETLKGEQ